MVTGLTVDTDGSAAPAKLILGTGDSASGHQHDEVEGVGVEITELVDGE